MNTRMVLTVLAILSPAINPALAQGIDRNGVWSTNKQAVVKIQVTGRNASGAAVPVRKGSGVIIRSNGVILTALHVVGQENEWFESPNGRDRKIEVFGIDNYGIERPLGVASARPVPSLDIAILTITANNLVGAVEAEGVPP
jgi:S1-C subfamily serine protease